MSIRDSRLGVRATQTGLLVLLLVCSAQLAYWMIDEAHYTASVRDELRAALQHQPGTTPEMLARLDADRFHRMNRYAWEGGFFLVVLAGTMGVVYSALREEYALVGAVLRRSARNSAAAAKDPVLRFGGNEFNVRTFRARSAGGVEQVLTQKEALILQLLVEREGDVIRRDDIVDRVWGNEVLPSSRTVEGLIVRLRKRFEPDPDRPQYLHTIRGVGYRFSATAEQSS
ncbi:MAG TPA: response regulator transcription factor [Gemmatimonadaceae bacterium]|nr:response regulator transcription factor [Gemmatimonadaceae bacterium]